MEENRVVDITKKNGNVEKVNLITFLMSEDGVRQYIVYSKGETSGVDEERIIYISKVINQDDVIKISEIVDDVEWNEVQKLLRIIANSK